VARLGDGWLPSLCTPQEAADGRATIERLASEVGRRIDPEHFGVSLAYARERIPERQLMAIARRRPGLDPANVVPVGYAALRATVERFIEVGFSKFVIRPAEAPTDWSAELDELAEQVLTLQT
jgi:hypothetical protein